ncbi:phospholipase effector Tle1 domain-containing protein [[Erwinia] mediterraneensis]|uniref:phospholipase effector Tle1 domain-containing protein n=1 Tax=[Erwinia] mediterraneensis TaxID=2161819 RepID=UPI0010315719|nr:DUF2235 domain-containing protein [[Erwinia] mediterraneensis]
MKTGHWIVSGDRTSCGGIVLEGSATKFMGPDRRPVATVGCTATCGKYSGNYCITGGFPGETIEGRYAASTLYSRVNCPCNATLIPSQTWAHHALHPETTEQNNFSEHAQHAQAARKIVTLGAGHEEKDVKQKRQEITLTIGIFFDGTGNNAVNTENMMAVCKARHYSLSDPDIKSILERCAKEMTGVSGIRSTSYIGYYTNVHWLKTLYKTDLLPASGNIQASLYIEGIGTESGKPDSQPGQGMGIADTGVIAKTDRAVSHLAQIIHKTLSDIKNDEPDTEFIIKSLQFDIFGFSRGAAASRHFANRVQSEDSAIINAIRLGLQDYEFRGAPAGKIRFIGLFDTVAAIGTPTNGLNPHNADTGDVNIILRPGVAEKVFHITAQHECRFNFALNSVSPAWPELALPGVHSDIGGGYLPVVKEDLFLSRPETETVPLRQADDKTRVYRRASDQLAVIKEYPALASLLRTHPVTVESWHDERMPQNKYSDFQKRSYAALTLRNRLVKHDWSKVVLRVMIDAAQEAGVIFNVIDFHNPELSLPAELIPHCEKALAMGKAVRTGQPVTAFTPDELDQLAKEYIHCSAHWNALITDQEGLLNGGAAPADVISFIHRPDEQWTRTCYNMDGKQI